MSIYLYIKTHNVTGLKYFGKTTKPNPYNYTGSGKYWLRHLKKHGNDISTEIFGHYENIEECKKEALKFSKEHNIVKSKEWANLQEENGIDGNLLGNFDHINNNEEVRKKVLEKASSTESRKKAVSTIRKKFNGDWSIKSEENRKAQSLRMKNNNPNKNGLTEEQKRKISLARKMAWERKKKQDASF